MLFGFNFFAFGSLFVSGVVLSQAQEIHVWDLALTEQPGQLTVYNLDPDDAQFGTPMRSGDLDGDGYGDLVISAMAGVSAPEEQSCDNIGEVVSLSVLAISAAKSIYAINPLEWLLSTAKISTAYSALIAKLPISMEMVRTIYSSGFFYADGPDREDAGKLYFITSELLAEVRAGGGVWDPAKWIRLRRPGV